MLLINRCLEEGAEEFFLKPVKLSDVNRLKPHLLKAKGKDQNQAKEEEELKETEFHIQQKQEQQSQPPQQQQLQQSQQPQQQSPQQQQSNNSNKRKALEEGLSPDRTRPRYSGLAVV